MKIFKSILIFTLLASFLTANIGFSLNKHLCHGKVKSIAIYDEAEKCVDESNHHAHDHHVPHESSCCDDETDYVQEESFKNFSSEFDVDCKFVPVKLVSELMMEAIPPSILASNKGYYYFKDDPLPPPVPLNIQYCTYLI